MWCVASYSVAVICKWSWMCVIHQMFVGSVYLLWLRMLVIICECFLSIMPYDGEWVLVPRFLRISAASIPHYFAIYQPPGLFWQSLLLETSSQHIFSLRGRRKRVFLNWKNITICLRYYLFWFFWFLLVWWINTLKKHIIQVLFTNTFSWMIPLESPF